MNNKLVIQIIEFLESKNIDFDWRFEYKRLYIDFGDIVLYFNGSEIIEIDIDKISFEKSWEIKEFKKVIENVIKRLSN